jgi:hypothetical protein
VRYNHEGARKTGDELQRKIKIEHIRVPQRRARFSN